jgi:hypothetical protein
MSASAKVYVSRLFEVYLLDRPFLSTKDPFIKKLFVHCSDSIGTGVNSEV